jgi:DedD protein
MMDPTLKNRLVGVVVLLLLAVVLLPMLLDGDNESGLLADTRLPVVPDVPSAESLLAEPPAIAPDVQAEIDAAHAPAEPESVPPVAVAPGAPPDYDAVVPPPVAESMVTQATVAQKPPVVQPPPVAATPVVAAAAAPQAADPRLASLADAWDVQVAALSTLEAANQLKGKLAAAGYKSRVLAAGKLFRVVVGPELRREDAVALRDKLAADNRFGKPSGLLVRYVP